MFAWDNFPHLGIWMRRGGDFLCLEPWQGFSSPHDFAGDFREKPGLLHIPPGESRSAMHRMSVL
jgi:galactose mutarotase-like enzyme